MSSSNSKGTLLWTLSHLHCKTTYNAKQLIFLLHSQFSGLLGQFVNFKQFSHFPKVYKLTTWRLEQYCQFDTDHVITRHSTYKLLRTDTINASPVPMDFSMIAQRTAKDNLSLNLISTQRWWALFWLAWLAVCVYLGLLWPSVISRAVSACTCVCICASLSLFRLPSESFI